MKEKAEPEYRTPEGEPTSEVKNFTLAWRPLLYLFGNLSGALDLLSYAMEQQTDALLYNPDADDDDADDNLVAEFIKDLQDLAHRAVSIAGHFSRTDGNGATNDV